MGHYNPKVNLRGSGTLPLLPLCVSPSASLCSACSVCAVIGVSMADVFIFPAVRTLHSLPGEILYSP